MLDSHYTELGPVTLSAFKNRQFYMHSFDVARPVMADGFEDYEAVVSELCRKAGLVSGVAHMTVDEKFVEPGMSQRRPGAHLDGCFMPSAMAWQHPSWLHYCNALPVERMAIITAASVPGCIVYPGKFDAAPKNDGDMEHIRDQLGDGELLPAFTGFLLSPDCVHESVRFPEPTQRTFLRIAFKAGD
jgi:hypothetical protein